MFEMVIIGQLEFYCWQLKEQVATNLRKMTKFLAVEWLKVHVSSICSKVIRKPHSLYDPGCNQARRRNPEQGAKARN